MVFYNDLYRRKNNIKNMYKKYQLKKKETDSNNVGSQSSSWRMQNYEK